MIWDELRHHWPCLADACVIRVERSENTTWLLAGSKGRFALRRYRDNHSGNDSIRAELEFMRLAREALSVAVPDAVVTKSDDQFLLASDGSYVLFTLVEGAEATHDDMRRIAPKLGEVTAILHRCVQQSCQLDPWSTGSRWSWDLRAFEDPVPRWGAWETAIVDDKETHALLSAAYDEMRWRLESAPRDAESFGLIHADLRAANVLLVESDLAGIIDFDDCGFGWYIYDAVTALSFYESSPGSLALLEGWIEGYQQIHDLDSAMLALLPSLIIYRRLLLTAWLESHPHASIPGVSRSTFLLDTRGLAIRYLEEPEEIRHLLS